MAKYKPKIGRSPGRFSALPHSIQKSAAWAVCKPPAVAVYLRLLLRYNGINNGYIPLSCREASEECHISKNTAKRAFDQLEGVGLIKCITPSNFNSRKKLAREWAFTHHPVDGGSATNEWKHYKNKTQCQI